MIGFLKIFNARLTDFLVENPGQFQKISQKSGTIPGKKEQIASLINLCWFVIMRLCLLGIHEYDKEIASMTKF
jgi:hypothetical protein